MVDCLLVRVEPETQASSRCTDNIPLYINGSEQARDFSTRDTIYSVVTWKILTEPIYSENKLFNDNDDL